MMPVGPVVTGVGHVVVVHELALVAGDAVHEATGTELVLLLEQTVVV